MPTKTVSKIYRKHLAESIGESRGYQEVQGRYTLGPCDWLSRPGYRKWLWDPGLGRANTQLWGALQVPPVFSNGSSFNSHLSVHDWC